jgi:uncharacterized protein (UPF0261 family)
MQGGERGLTSSADSSMPKTIAVIASLDTKGKEVLYVKEGICRLGHKSLIIDVSVNGEPVFKGDLGPEEVARAAGSLWPEVRLLEKKVRIMTMAKGLAALLPALFAEGRLDAVLSLGGAQNTTMGTSGMRALPIGVPKLMVSTMASGQRIFDPFVGTRDLMLLHSVADVAGVNLITRPIMDNAVAAICGMVENAGKPIAQPEHLVVGATMLGVTNDGVARAVGLLEEAGLEVVTFHASGVGGRSLEESIREGLVGAVFDLTIHEIVCEIFGGFSSGVTGRLNAAAERSLPQLVAPGAADVVDWAESALPGLPDWERRPRVYQHPTVLHLKLHPPEAAKVGQVVASRLNASRGPVTVLFPRRGLHQLSYPGGPLWQPETDEALFQALRRGLKHEIQIQEVDANINDVAFSQAAAAAMLKLLGRKV